MVQMDIRVANKYRIGRRIGGGSFGEIYQGTNVQTGETVAIKLEPVRSKHPQLLFEAKLYKVMFFISRLKKKKKKKKPLFFSAFSMKY